MIIVTYDDNYDAIIAEYNSPLIKLEKLKMNGNSTLGDMRNHAIAISGGEYFCNWDDDDWSHPSRLHAQFNATVNNYKAGSLLAYCLMYNRVDRIGYLSYPMFLAATLFLQKKSSIGDIRYAKRNINEDDPFIRKLHQENLLYAHVEPTLYIYVFHGKNTWNRQHFEKIFSLSAPFNEDVSLMIGRIVNHDYTIEEAVHLLKDQKFISQFNYFRAFTLQKEREYQ